MDTFSNAHLKLFRVLSYKYSNLWDFFIVTILDFTGAKNEHSWTLSFISMSKNLDLRSERPHFVGPHLDPNCLQIYVINSLRNQMLLCVSCPSATEFSAILFLLLARSSSNSPRSFQRFRRTLVPNFIQIRQQVFPIDSHCKKCPLLATL